MSELFQSAPKKSSRRTTMGEIRKINRLLDEHMKRVTGTEDAPGECEYRNDMTDAKIASLVAADLAPSAIANIRLQIFGKLHRENAEASASAQMRAELVAHFDDRLAKHQVSIDGFDGRLKQMEGVLLELAVKFNRFVTAQVGEGSDKFVVSTAWERRPENGETK